VSAAARFVRMSSTLLGDEEAHAIQFATVHSSGKKRM